MTRRAAIADLLAYHKAERSLRRLGYVRTVKALSKHCAALGLVILKPRGS